VQTKFIWLEVRSNGQEFSTMVMTIPVNTIRVDFLSCLSIINV